MEQKQLRWGETPWDNLSREELLREVQRAYDALIAVSSCLNMAKARSGVSAEYWGYGGMGGRALEMARQVTEPIETTYGSENIYSSFFRYAVDLLFDQSTGFDIGFGWAVCPECGITVGTSRGGESPVGKPCSEYRVGKKGCQGIMRTLEWKDLEPKDWV